MKYEEIVTKVKEILSNKDISDYKKHLAIQFNITGEGEGAFYVEFNNGNIVVEPFEYYDRDAIVTISSENLFAILDGSLDTTAGYVDKYFDVTNLGIINEFKNVITEANETEVEDKQLELVQEEVVKAKPVETKKETKSTTTNRKTNNKKTTSTKKKSSKSKK